MIVKVVRKWFSAASTQGELFLDGLFEAYTLEPSRASGKLLPAGTYPAEIARTYAPRLVATLERLGMPLLTPHLIGPPGPIEIHFGNTAKDTEGCTLVGQTMQADSLGSSDDAFRALMAKLPPSFVITYEFESDDQRLAEETT